ncbi:MAG: selenocysteine-specific translation elongation factor [SAR202 cluster bacterium]|nr:selenocysteine-specific translation elongation factor [SAR202 cluster bacterium]
MYVVGTAGHVDHGKSTLIKALTGIDPDRLPEEKAREMTIDLGFAWLTLPSGREVSVIDVPGHERFVHNMLAGVGGVDLALLVVACDEGVMTQTREHLAILDLLQVKSGLVALTKADLVDAEMLDLVKLDTEESLKGTVFEKAPMMPVSSYTGKGIPELKRKIDDMLTSTPPRPDVGRPRLAVDRSFTVAGFGTVVTGTLIGGSLGVGQEAELAPSGRKVRIRGLQTHKQKLDKADPGRRLAINLTGVSHDEVRRGEVLTNPGWLKPTNLVDVRLKLIKDAPRPMKHNARVSFHLLASETAARVRLLDTKELQPGQEAWAQVHMEDPLPVVKDDFFVVRDTETTLGGGRVADAQPKRHRAFSETVLESLSRMEQGSPGEAVLSSLEQAGPSDIATLAQRGNQALSEALPMVESLAKEGRLVVLGDGEVRGESAVYSNRAWEALEEQAQTFLAQYHRQFPLRKGASREEMRSRLGLSAPLFPLVLARLIQDEVVTEDASLVRLPQHKVSMKPQQEQQAASYLKALASDPFSPPTDQPIDPALLALLIEEGRVVRVDASVVLSADAYKQAVNKITSYIRDNGKITVADARTLLNSTRKYVLPLLEYMDQQRITRRVGDERVLR